MFACIMAIVTINLEFVVPPKTATVFEQVNQLNKCTISEKLCKIRSYFKFNIICIMLNDN